MDVRPTNKLTAKQHALLTKARDAIKRRPETYDQMTYGTGTINCETPGCVAGHIVETDVGLQAELSERITCADLSVAQKGQVAGIVNDLATTALGTGKNPLLLRGCWPTAWLNLAAKPNKERRKGVGDDPTFVPSPKEAVLVIDAILNGQIQGALESV